MGLELPGWVEPFLNLYGIPWPDVNEDAFHEMQQPLRDFGSDLVAVSDAIETAINDLESGSPSQTLRAIGRYCAEIRRDFLDPIRGVCDDLAGQPCELAYDAVLAAKWTLIGLLTAEVGDDVVDIVATVATLGLDAGLTLAEALAVREAVQAAIQEGEAEVASLLQSLANKALDNFVNSLVNPFINSIEGSVEARVDSYMPRLVLNEAIAAIQVDDAVAQRLHLSPDQLNQSVSAIGQSSQHLYQAASKLDGCISDIFSKPDPSAPQINSLSQDMRIALQSVVQTIKTDLIQAIDTLLSHVEQHFVKLLQDFAKAVAELDEDARRAAAAEHMAAMPEVVVVTAAGTWVAASSIVDPTTGRVDAAEAEKVKVGEAQEVAFATGVESRVNASAQPVSETPVTFNDAGIQSLDVKADLQGPGVAEADKGLNQVEQLNINTNQDAPHLAMAQSSGAPAQGIGPHAEHHAPHAGSAGPGNVAGVDHLHVQKEGHKPTTAAADGSSGDSVQSSSGADDASQE